MRHILLTWNPGPSDDREWTRSEFLTEMVVPTADGVAIDGRWSVSNRRVGIDPGDRAYLLRQGSHGRGIVATGTIRTRPYPAEHWSEPGKAAQYVDVAWEEAIPVDTALTIEQLTAVTAFDWGTVYASGREVPGADGTALHDAWLSHAQDAARLPHVLSGAGFGDAKTNKRVEDAAVKYVIGHLKSKRGCTDDDITDVSKLNLGWDLTVLVGGDEEHIEVKGVSGSLPRFFLTANEHRAASIDSAWRLVVVTDALTNSRRARFLDAPSVIGHAVPAVYQVRVPQGKKAMVN